MSANLAQVEPWAPLPRQTDGALAPRGIFGSPDASVGASPASPAP